MSIVVGCSLIHAGTHPLSMNIGPSFFMDLLITSNVDWIVEVESVWFTQS
jgi:hypothetical protein